MQSITPFLWFDGQAEEAAALYTSVFPNSKIKQVTRYGEAIGDVSGQRAGTVMTVAFELDGQDFTALNGGPHFQFTEAISFVVTCRTQQEIDHYWDRLSENGEESRCGWLKDRFGVSWQIVPAGIGEWMSSAEPERANRVMEAILPMKKLDMAILERAYRGER